MRIYGHKSNITDFSYSLIKFENFVSPRALFFAFLLKLSDELSHTGSIVDQVLSSLTPQVLLECQTGWEAKGQGK